jgi:hypothetical protein
MKKLLLSIVTFILTNTAFAAFVPANKAFTVAYNFIHSSLVQSNGNNAIDNLSLSSVVNTSTNSSLPAYYIFAGQNNVGFIIIAADDIVSPVLGYSVDSKIDLSNKAPAFVKWMNGYKEQISFAIQTNMYATEDIKTDWDNYFNNTIPTNRSPLTVNPLCATNWDQQPYVNIMCPNDAANTTNQHCVTGCPATAMAQIMKYWNYPAQGSGIHQYNHPTYGTLSANFGATTYNWGAMPNNVTSNNTAISTLMYHCGVAVNMQYSANSSGAYVIINSPTPTACSEYAYKTYFKYNPTTIQGLERANYNDTQWKNLLKADLNASQPIQYAGFGSGGGHTFVCDGFDANDFFHMNWGWGGYQNGFFAINALNPGGLGTGGGTGGYNSDQQAVIGIKPITTTPVGNSLALYSNITINPNPIGFYQGFTVNADIINNAATTFNGDYTAALFNSNYNFVDYIQTFTGNTLQSGFHYTGGINFTTAGILTVPGNYFVGLFYREAGGNWNLIANGSYNNMVPVTISGPQNYIKLYSSITPSPATFVQGQAASVNLNILNDGTSTYYGTFSVNLYDLQGNFVETVGTLVESNGLPVGYVYNPPYLTFNSTSIAAPPGTYILAAMEQENGFNQYLVGGALYTNPIYINVVAANLTPDIYEQNNTAASAYTLATNYVSNLANVNTSGSNIHIGTDIDFYKVNLAAGYSYQITARVQDSYNSNNGITYSNDVLWSYDAGSGFSQTYDDVMSGSINVNGPATVTFQVADYFVGTTGTYRLDLSIARTLATNITESTNQGGINLFPNPANQLLTIQPNDSNTKINQIQVYDLLGKLVLNEANPSSNLLDVSSLNKGLYFIIIVTENATFKSKFNVSK